MSDNETLSSTCPARHVCRLVGTERCNVACAWNVDLRYQIALSGIPDEYTQYTVESLSSDSENIDTLRSFAAVAAERKPKNGLFLTSATTGTGKTTAACAVAMSFILARTRRALARGESVGQLVQFVGTTELLDLLRLAMNDDAAQGEANRLIDRIGKAQLVILDDFGAERVSEWVGERFYAIINAIWSNRTKQTLIATSNATLDQIELRYGDTGAGKRIRSRVDGLCIVLPFKGDDRRRNRYENGGAK